MMRVLVSLYFLLIPVLLAGDLPWIGVSLKCPDKNMTAYSKLPEGAGLEVSEVIRHGPLDEAGGKTGDVWWKFDGQILVSRGQLVVLLRGKKAGDVVDVEYFREGISKKTSIRLENWPDRKALMISNRGSSFQPSQQSKKLESSKQTASLTVNGEQLTLEKTDEGWRLEVRKDGQLLADKELTSSNISTSLESRWMEPFMILQMTLAQKMPGETGDPNQRVRYISRKPESKESN